MNNLLLFKSEDWQNILLFPRKAVFWDPSQEVGAYLVPAQNMIWLLKWPWFFNRARNAGFLFSRTWSFPRERSPSTDTCHQLTTLANSESSRCWQGKFSLRIYLSSFESILGQKLSILSLRQICILKLSWHETIHFWLVLSSITQACWKKSLQLRKLRSILEVSPLYWG